MADEERFLPDDCFERERAGERGSAPLELVLLAPVLVLLVVFVLWAGRGGRAGLIADLAAGEAAVVASLASDDPDDEGLRESVVQDVLLARPGLDLFCIGGPQPRALGGAAEFVDEAWLEGFQPEERGTARGVGAIGVRFECETDGAVAPLRGLFPTVSFFGQAAEVIALPPRPVLSVKGASYLEGDPPDPLDPNPPDPNKLEFLVELSAPATQLVDVYYWTASGGREVNPVVVPATAIDDYGHVPATPDSQCPGVYTGCTQIAVGDTSVVVDVDIVGDRLYEHDERLDFHWRIEPSDPCAPDAPVLDDPDPAGSQDIECDPGQPNYGGPVSGSPSSPVPVGWTAKPARGVIANDDPAPTLQVSGPNPGEDAGPTAGESAGRIEFVVSLNAPTAVGVVYEYATSDGTAEAGKDYTAASSHPVTHATLNPNAAISPSESIFVDILDDGIGEDDEVFYLQVDLVGDPLNNGTVYAQPSTVTATGTITDDEPKITIGCNPENPISDFANPTCPRKEGETLKFDVTLSLRPAANVTVDYGTTAGSATAGADYMSASGTLTFTPTGPTTQTIAVTTVGDALDENNEDFTVALSNASANAYLDPGASSATGTIQDDDDPPTLTIRPASAVEGDPVVFTATLSGPTSFPVEFRFTTADDTATAPDDYVPILSTAPISDRRRIIGPGNTSATPISVPTKDDSAVEGEETFDLKLSSASNVSGYPSTVTGTIQDATSSSRDVRVSDATAREGLPLEFTITLVGGADNPIPTGSELRVGYEVVEAKTGCPSACATENVDYRHTGSGFVTFESGDEAKTVTVETLTDEVTDPGERLFLKLLTPLSPGFGCSVCQGTGTITDWPLPVLTVSGDSKPEDSELEFTVTLTPASDLDTQFDVYTYALTAGAGADYEITREGTDQDESRYETITIPAIQNPPASTTTTVTVETNEDDLLEADETLQLRLANPRNAQLGDPHIGVGTIEDVLPRVVSVQDAVAVAGDKMGFVIGLTRRAEARITVQYGTASRSASGALGCDEAGADYVIPQEHAVVFEPGDVSKTVDVQTCADDDPDSETFFLRLIGLTTASPGVRLGDSQAEGTITTRYSRLSIANAEATEGQNLEFTVTREGRTDLAATVGWFAKDLAAGDRRATSGADYEAASGKLTFAVGQAEQTITVEALDDDVAEWPHEQFLVELQNPVGVGLAKSVAVGTINEPCINPGDGGSTPPTITGKDQTVDEGSAGLITVEFTVDTAVCSDSPATVRYGHGLSGDGATPGIDYSATSGPITFSGYVIRIADVLVLDDALDEDDETFRVFIEYWQSGNPAFRGAHSNLNLDLKSSGLLAAASITITDDDALPVVSVNQATAVEGQDVRLSVRLDRPSGRQVTVDYYTRPDNSFQARRFNQRAAPGSAGCPSCDYTAISDRSPAELDFAPGETEKFAAVSTNSDSATEVTEHFFVHLADPTNATIGTGRATAYIADRSLPGLSIRSNYEATGAKAAEPAAGEMASERFTVTLDEAPTGSGTVSVDWATHALSGAGAAAENADYSRASGTLVFTAGQTSKDFSVAILADGVVEGDERFQVRLSDARRAVIGDGIAATVIEGQCTDSGNAGHAVPRLGVADVSIDEGHPTGAMNFVITVDRPLCSAVPVSVSLDHGTTAPADFDRVPSGTFLFSSGRTSVAYTRVVVADDAVPEDDETFKITVAWNGPDRWNAVAAVEAEGTIVDDDDKAVVSVGPASAPEGGRVSFPVTLDKPAEGEITVGWTTKPHNSARASNRATPGAACGGDADFVAASGTVTIAAGDAAGAILVLTCEDDRYNEADETFLVELSRPNEYADIGVRTAVGEILNAAAPPNVSVGDADADEGQTLEFEVTLDNQSRERVLVEYRTCCGTATPGPGPRADYLLASGVLEFAPGETQKTVLVAALADDEDREADETLQVRLSNPTNAQIDDGTGIGTIRNLGVPGIEVGDARAAEGDSVVFTVSLGNRANRDITVDYAAVARLSSGDVAATAGDDFTAVSGVATIAAGATEATVAVPAVDDRLDEYTEVFALVLSDPDYGNLADANATGSIIDNDDEPAVSAAAAAALEDAGTMPVTVGLDAPSGRTVAVDYALAATGTGDGHAAAGEDFAAASGTLTIPAGRVAATVNVALLDDDDAEGAETLAILLSNPRNAALAGSGAAVLTIIDDEGPPTVYLEPDAGGSVEGEDAQITLRLSHASEEAVSVRYATSDGSAAAGADYTAASGTATIAAGDTEATLSTGTVDDDEEEETETFNWTISLPAGQDAQLGRASGPSLILDNDGRPEIIVDDASAAEGGVATFTVRLTAPADNDVTVDYATEADAFAGAAAAVAGQDFTPASGTATIAAGDQSATVGVALVDDALDEGVETFWLRLGAAAGADVADALAIGAIADNDPEPALSISNARASEGDPVRFAVALSEPSGRVVRVQYAPQPHAAAARFRGAVPVDDYNPAAKTLAIPAGVTAAVAEVDAYNDQITEYPETFLVRLFNPVHATLADPTATGTIIDQTGVPQAAIADAEAAEGDGQMTLTVTLSHPSTATVTIAYATRPTGAGDGHAAAPADYTAQTGTITLAPGTTAQTIAIAIADDDTVEADETFEVLLRNPQNASLTDNEAVATIIDDDGLPRLSITAATAAEADGHIAFTVSLSHPSTSTATVDYATFDNTATQPADYTAATGTITLPPGTTNQTIEVPIADDRLDEHDETLTVRLNNPRRATVRPANAAAAGTIQDDDPLPSLTLLDAVAAEGEPLRFTAQLDAPSGRTVTAGYTTADNTAQAPADYTHTTGTITLPPGTTAQTITVQTRTDARTETPETLTLTLTSPLYATLADPQATGTIQNRQPPTITINNATALEGNPVVFTLEMNQPTNTNVEVVYEVTPLEATAGVDYTVPNPARVTIPAGQTQTTLAIPTTADSTLETDETFLVRLTRVAADNAQIRLGAAVGTILENALAPALSVDDPQVSEGDTAEFTVTLTRDDNTADGAVSVAFRTRPLTAAEGADYTARTGRLEFPAAETTQQLTVSVPTASDTLSEASETFQLELHSPQGEADITDSLGTATILDDDSEPTLSISAAEADEGTPLEFTATLNSPSGRRITADYRTSGNTATDGVDYVSAAGTLAFPAGTTSQTITVATLPDTLVEDDETLQLALSNPAGAVLADGGASGEGTIIDATRPAIRVADAAAQEGDNLEFTITLNRQSDDRITVAYATADGTAAQPADYTAASGTAVFAPGTTRQTVTVTTLTDTRDESDETLTLTLASPSAGARILDGTATGTIRNAARPLITANSTAQAEGSQLTFQVWLSRPAENTVTVNYRTVDGTATGTAGTLPRSGEDPGWNEVDYKHASGTLTFTPGATMQTVTVMLASDFVDELAETFHLELRNAVNADLPTDPYRATATVLDTTPTPTFSFVGERGIREEDRNTEYDVVIWPVSDRTVTVDYSVENAPQGVLNRATAGADFHAATGTLTFPPGTRLATIHVRHINDDDYEGTENYRIVLSNPVNGVLYLSNTTNNKVIDDDESYVSAFIDRSVVEGRDVEFTVLRAGRNMNAVSLNFQTVDGTAKAGTDYQATSGTINFIAKGVNTIHHEARIRVRTYDDDDDDSEYFTVRLTPTASSPRAIGIGESEARATIVPSTETIATLEYRGSPSVLEGEVPSFLVRLDGGSTTLEDNPGGSEDFSATVRLVSETARYNANRYLSDFYFCCRYTASWDVELEAGSRSIQTGIWTEDDPVDEPDETFRMELTNVKGATLGEPSSITITIRDNDPPPELRISDAAQQEGRPAEFIVSLPPPDFRGRYSTAFPVSVNYATADVSAIAGQHYTATRGTLEFAVGEIQKTITVPTTNNSTLSGDRVFAVVLSNPVNATISRGTGRGRIIEDDCVDAAVAGFVPPTLRLAAASADEDVEGGELSFTVSIAKPFCRDVAQAVSVSAALGSASAADATTPSGVVGFKAGETTAEYSGVRILDDSLDENDETVVATASWHRSLDVGAAYRSVSVEATGTIVDDDDEPALEVLDAAAAEAGALVFIVTLDAPSGREVTVDYATARVSGDRAAGAGDYTAASGTLTFAAGETVKQVVVSSTGDALDEHDETFQLKLSNPQNATLEDGIAVGTIEDDDPLPTVSIANASAAEDNAGMEVRFTITLTPASGRDVTVAYTTADGTAIAGDDYTAATGTATITAGNDTTTIDISVTDDNTAEPDETFTVQLLDATDDDTHQTAHATIHNTEHTATGTITNDD